MSIPNQYIVGQVIGLTDLITNPNSTPTADQPVDDGSDVVTVYAPDGTSSTPTVTHGATNSGAYTAQFTPTQTGWHEYVWKSTGSGAGAGRGRFYVSPVP
jgi:hypothetical protein